MRNWSFLGGVLPSHLTHLVRSREHIRTNRQRDLLRRSKIYHQLELRRLLHRKIGTFGGFEDLVDVGGATPVTIRGVRPISYESGSIDTVLVTAKRWYRRSSGALNL